MGTNKQEQNQGLNIFREIYSELENLNDQSTDQEIQTALELAVERCSQARVFFQDNNQSWTAAWISLRQASLHCELAEGANYMGRGVQVHAAMTLIKDVLDQLPQLPPNLDLTSKIYINMIETLFRIRSLFDKPDQLEAIDNLIRGVSENLGEAMAMDLSLRSEANDLEFTAGILDALADLEEDPQIKKDLQQTSLDLSRQAAGNLSISSPLDLSAYAMPREGK